MNCSAKPHKALTIRSVLIGNILAITLFVADGLFGDYCCSFEFYRSNFSADLQVLLVTCLSIDADMYVLTLVELILFILLVKVMILSYRAY